MTQNTIFNKGFWPLTAGSILLLEASLLLKKQKYELQVAVLDLTLSYSCVLCDSECHGELKATTAFQMRRTHSYPVHSPPCRKNQNPVKLK